MFGFSFISKASFSFTDVNDGFMKEKTEHFKAFAKMTILQPLLTTSRPLDITSSGIILLF